MTMMDDLDCPVREIGEDWEERFWGLLRRRYERAGLTRIPSTMGGDRGLEGFSHDGIGYQCFADRDSMTLRHRTEKQKRKIRDDTNKLRDHQFDLRAILGGIVLDRWVLAVPEYHAAELVAYANGQATKVCGWGLPFIATGFRVVIH
jgi:hypothetical protein